MNRNIKWIVIGVVLISGMLIFKPALMSMIERTTDVQVSTDAKGNISLKVKAALQIAEAENHRSGVPLTDIEVDKIAEETEKIEVQKLNQKLVLWVDDTPSNNKYEISAFRQLGISVQTITNGSEAIEKLRNENVSVVISDFKRPNDPRYGGYGLLDEMKSQGINVPFVIYSAETTPQYRADSISRGAVDQTNRASELYSAVLSSIIGH